MDVQLLTAIIATCNLILGCLIATIILAVMISGLRAYAEKKEKAREDLGV